MQSRNHVISDYNCMGEGMRVITCLICDTIIDETTKAKNIPYVGCPSLPYYQERAHLKTQWCFLARMALHVDVTDRRTQ